MLYKYDQRTQNVLVHFYFSHYFGGVFDNTIIPLALVGYKIIMTILVLRASLVIYHLMSNKRKWNKCYIIASETSYHLQKL